MKQIVLCSFFFLASLTVVQAQIPLNAKVGSAKAIAKAGQLTVSTGKVERTWAITTHGLQTIGIKNTLTGKKWVTATPQPVCDWSYVGLVSDTSICKLINLTARKNNDEGFTSDHLEVIAEFEYPATRAFIRYHIWAYPDAPGLRTQVWIKGKANEQMLTQVAATPKNELTLKLFSGTKERTYAAAGVAKLWDASVTQANNAIEYQLFGLKKNKTYQLGLSWWDYEGKGRTQRVSLTSVDGERSVEVVPPTPVPDYAHDKAMPKERVVDIPGSISLDGSLRIRIAGTTAAGATIGEIWVYEKGGKTPQLPVLNGDENRIAQLRSKAVDGYILAAYADCGDEPDEAAQMVYGRCDYLPIDGSALQRLYAGYYNDTQHRNTEETPLLKEEYTQKSIADKETVNWASLLLLSAGKEGIGFVKESQKCVNQYGVETGDFVVSKRGVENRGTSLYPKDLSSDAYKWYWASWMVLWEGNTDAGILAVKKFDRLRYPIDPARDIYIMANTWGSSRNKEAAKEQNVLIEIDRQAELGIDIQQIDDGWQDKNWRPSTAWYPTGWGNVVQRAKEKDVKLGLWGAAMPITQEALRYNFDNGHFVTYKLDFANLSSHDKIDETIGKIRNFVLYTGHKVRVNWDVTENAPRYGYFWAREYGSVFLENRKPDVPANAVYVPHLVLRDLWHLSRYTNLNKFQGSVQNVDRVDKKLSDAYLHSHAYATAIPLMSSPLFFQETQFLSDEAVAEIKPILAAYKKVRNDMYDCYVYPIGNEPTNKTWAGFQAWHPSKKTGYLTLFREIENTDEQMTIALHLLPNRSLTFTNLLTGEKMTAKTDASGAMTFTIPKKGDFRFYTYQY